MLISQDHTYRRQIDITTYQIRKIKADTSLCLFTNDIHIHKDTYKAPIQKEDLSTQNIIQHNTKAQ